MFDICQDFGFMLCALYAISQHTSSSHKHTSNINTGGTLALLIFSLCSIAIMNLKYHTDICCRQKINKYSAGRKFQDII
jgi:hypothetical protein